MTVVKLCGVSDPAAVRAIVAIASFWNVTVTIDAECNGQVSDGVIFGDGYWQPRISELLDGAPFLGFVGGSARGTADPANEVTFAGNPAVPETLRGKTLLSIEPTFSASLRAVTAMDDAAFTVGRAIWKVSSNRLGSSFVVATPPPLLNEGSCLPQIFNGETFLHVLPVWLFLRGFVAQTCWRPPPLRACMVVDDPNLHRPSYGYLNYRKVLEFARTQPFHLAVAMVPLDGWWVSPNVAKIFRENPNDLSLLVHGNDHLPGELAQPLSDEERRALISQSLGRTLAVERKKRLQVDRVMAPPHGVCSREMMDSLWRAGFDGLNSNRWSLWKHSPPETLPQDAFLRPAAMLAEGLPVVSRFRFSSPIFRNEIHMAALLGQPIVPYGHHFDFSRDMSDAVATADEINALDLVSWMSMREILETNFEHRISANTFEVRLFSRRICGTMPAGVTELVVTLPDNVPCGTGELRIESNAGTTFHKLAGRLGEPISLPAGSRFEVCLATGPQPPELTIKSFRMRPKVLLRRLASEVRDRLSPLAALLRKPV